MQEEEEADVEQRNKLLLSSNPKYVLRNWVVLSPPLLQRTVTFALNRRKKRLRRQKQEIILWSGGFFKCCSLLLRSILTCTSIRSHRRRGQSRSAYPVRRDVDTADH